MILKCSKFGNLFWPLPSPSSLHFLLLSFLRLFLSPCIHLNCWSPRRASACLLGRQAKPSTPPDQRQKATKLKWSLVAPPHQREMSLIWYPSSAHWSLPQVFSGPGSSPSPHPWWAACLLGQGFPEQCLQMSLRAPAKSEEDLKMCVLISWCFG